MIAAASLDVVGDRNIKAFTRGVADRLGLAVPAVCPPGCRRFNNALG
jgi:hypothetical protein